MKRFDSRTIRVVGIAVAVLVAPAVISVLPGVLVLGVLPAMIGLALLGLSIQAIVRQRSATQMLLGTLAISLSAMSLWTLKRVFLDGAWATYLPYYAIAAALPFVLIQSYLARAR